MAGEVRRADVLLEQLTLAGGRLRSRLASAIALGLTISCARAEPPGPTRHALLICMDTVRYDAWELVRAYAPPPQGSPWNRAVHLRRAQSTAPWTLPAVASVLTGRYPNAHGAGIFPREIADFRRELPTVLRDEGIVTLPETLRDAGFATASFTATEMFKWGGFRQGFHDTRRSQGVDSRRPLVRKVADWLDGQAEEAPGRRLFLYVHFVEAHQYAPRQKPERVAARIAEVPSALREAALAAAPAGSCAEPGAECETWLHYVSSIFVVRDAITQLLEDLAERGLLAEMSVALFSDHGEEFHDHRELGGSRGLDPRGDYSRGHGHTLFQEQLHVPVVFWHPDLRGRDVDAPATLVDLAPTLIEWLAVEAPESDGVALGRVLAGADFDRERSLFSSAVAFGPRREAVLRGDRKRLSGGGRAPDLEFDLDRDPAEAQPSQREAGDLEALLVEYRRGRSEPSAATPIDSETLGALQELGYLEAAEPSADAPAPGGGR